MKIPPNIVGDSNDKNNFPHKLLLTSTQVSKLCKVFGNNSLANIKLSKTQLHKIGWSRGFLINLFRLLLKTGLPLMTNVLNPLVKTVLIPLGFIRKYFLKIILISDEETHDIVKIVKSLEESSFLIKGISETIQKEAKEQKGGFPSILLGTFGASLLENILTGKSTIRKDEGSVRVGQDF